MSDVAPAPTSSGGAPSTPAPSAPSSGSPSPSSTGPGTNSAGVPSGRSPEQNKPSLSDQVNGKPQNGKSPEQRAEEIRRQKFKFKIDGEEVEEELDEHEVHTRLQKARAADKRMQEAAELRKKWADATAMLRDDPYGAMKLLAGDDFDLRDWAEKDILSRYEEAQLTPEQKRLKDLERENEKYKKTETARREKIEADKRQAYEKQIWEQTEQEFLKALDETGYDKPAAKALLPIMADIAEANLEYGLELTPAQLANETKKRVGVMTQQVMRGLTGERLLEFLGEDAVKAVLKAKLEKHRLAPAPAPTAEPTPAPKTDGKKFNRTRFRLGLED